MDIEKTEIAGVFILRPVKHLDPRGFFTETFRQDVFDKAAGRSVPFVQDNLAQSERAGTVRGLHCQIGKHAQGKLVSCASGRILDVAVDIRSGSKSFGQHVAVELSADTQCALFIPAGFLHGYATLTDGAQIRYKCSTYYNHAAERAVLWNDSELGIKWGIDPDNAIISAKDKSALPFSQIDWAHA